MDVISTNLNISLDKRRHSCYYLWLHCLNIGKVTFSEVTGTWFLNFCNISNDVHEAKTKELLYPIIEEEVTKFIEKCFT